MNLVLVPGLLCDDALWAHQRTALSERAAITIPDVTAASSVGAMAEAVLAQAPPGPFALAGLSMGGYIAFEILRRDATRIERLALLNTSPGRDTEIQARFRRSLMAKVEEGQFEAVTRHVLLGLVHPDRLKDRPLADAVRAMAERVGQEVFLRQQTAIMERRESWELLPAIRCPTLVLCGREDIRTPLAVHERMAAAIPASRLVVVERCGHLSSMERPDEVTRALLEWISQPA